MIIWCMQACHTCRLEQGAVKMLVRVHAGLLVLHAHADNPVEEFGRLWAQAKKPPLMRAGKMEARVIMHHLLLHADNAQPEGGYARCC